MTAPLYDIKARFSEYVTMAENGEVIEITKHGNATAVIISKKTYDQLQADYEQKHKPSFIQMLNKWKTETGGLTDKEALEFEDMLEKMRREDSELESRRGNPWD